MILPDRGVIQTYNFSRISGLYTYLFGGPTSDDQDRMGVAGLEPACVVE